MLFPVLPFIIRSYDQPELVLGILLWTFSFFQFILAPILWALSDKYGRKPVLILTQAGTLLSWIVLWIAAMIPEVMIFWYILLPIIVIFFSRVFDGITWANQSVANAMLSDMSEPDERSKVFGYNGAVFWVSLLVGPALGSLSLGLWWSYLGTAILWACVSLLTLSIMIFLLKESLDDSLKKKQAKIQFRELNIITGLKKWGKIQTIQYTLIMKVFIFIAFITYTSISTLYLIDVFGFRADRVGYYLMFTGSFLIFHQSVSIKYITSKLGDSYGLLLGMLIMSVWFLAMALSGENIWVFTLMYFFGVMGISLTFTTSWALISKSVSWSDQWEVLWISSSIESLISIWVPLLATYLYGVLDFSIFYFVALLPFLWLCLTWVMYRKACFAK